MVSVSVKLVMVYCVIKSKGMEIGKKVKVYRLRDKQASDKLGKVGTVQGYKMTDGSGVGVIVKFDDNASTWFFEDEIKALD